MALIGIQLDRKNPEFTSDDFTFWMPQFKNYVCYYSGKILVGESSKPVYIYSNDLYHIFIDNREIELVTADEILYNGSVIINEINYFINLNSQTMLLTLVGDSITTTSTLKSEGSNTYNHLYELANNKVFHSIYGSDWKLAMSLCIAHYLTLIANQLQAPSGNTLQGIAGGGNTRGVLSSISVGEFSKSYELRMTMVDENEAMFWNQTTYGAELMALLKTKAVPSILVVTSHPIPEKTIPDPFKSYPPIVPWEE